MSGQVQDIFREYCLAFCLALRPADIARGFQAQAPRPVEPVPLGALISASELDLCTLQSLTKKVYKYGNKDTKQPQSRIN